MLFELGTSLSPPLEGDPALEDPLDPLVFCPDGGDCVEKMFTFDLRYLKSVS